MSENKTVGKSQYAQLKEEASRQSDEILYYAAQTYGEGYLQACATSPQGMLAARFRTLDPHLDIRYVQHDPNQPQAGFEDTTTMSGLYTPPETDDDDAIIQVNASQTEERMNFTFLHELGHYLQHHDLDLLSNLFDIDDEEHAKNVEEMSCDMFAAHSLVPTGLVYDTVPTAQALTRLHGRLRASLLVVCRRFAEVKHQTILTVADTHATRVSPNGYCDMNATLTDGERDLLERADREQLVNPYPVNADEWNIRVKRDTPVKASACVYGNKTIIMYGANWLK